MSAPEPVDEDEEPIIEELPTAAASSSSQAAAAAEAGEEASAEDAEDSRRPVDKALDAIEEEKKNMTPLEKLERSLLWKCEGNGFFKDGQLFKAADCYYHAIIFARDLTQNPQYYPDLKHTQQDREKAKELCESTFTNLALVQLKYGSSRDPESDHEEREKILKEGSKSASEALKLNAKNVKALFRRAACTAALAKGRVPGEEAQTRCTEAMADLRQVIEAEPQNREARAELKAVQEHLKKLKREEREGEKREFAFASTLSALGPKEKDLLGDGSVCKRPKKTGDGGKWLNEDWLRWDGAKKCVVHVRVSPVDGDSSAGSPVQLSFILGDPDMHEGVLVAIKSMTKGEVAHFKLAQHRLKASSSLAKMLPEVKAEFSTWEIEFQKYVTWEDLDCNGERLRKLQEEGYGVRYAEDLSEVFAHWRVTGPDGRLIHSSRYTISMGGETGMTQVEDEDKEAPSYIIGEGAWEPLVVLCRGLRQGGVGELRLRDVPDLPQDKPGGDDTSAKLSLMMLKQKNRGSQKLRHCVVRVEVERVVPPLAGPGDERWEGPSAVVQERFRGEQLLELGEERAALSRLRRAVAWVGQLPESEASALASEAHAARASIGWVLASRAAPILDMGNVSSDVLAVAQKDLSEAEEHCAWLEANAPCSAGTRLLRAKILVAQDDDFAGAHQQLLEAQKVAPDDKRVQEELRKVKVELRKVQEEQSRAKVIELRDGLKRARTSEVSQVMPLLKQLAGTHCSWDTVMETRIGVELKSCQECGAEEKALCLEILGKLKDESKEQRPMWES
eukprot:TRINITY_DN9389_c0_g2_i1.p1 TRINITY_DN9389_c0_g2~~TRINITY_DN9389_c0_g2_i1.p1  ORF type:complete len:789 (-),score=227.10 TRINITY_DN9389_c0_g2_i1:95-2461(-)